MNRPVITIAAALIAATTLTNAKPAQAGMRLGFGVPLGMFVAHSLAESSRRAHHNDLRAQREARAAKIAAAKREAAIAAARREAVAEERERARKAKMLAKASESKASEEVKTVKLESKTVATDAAPTINVPATPVAAATSAPIETEVAKVSEIDDAVKIAAPKTEQLQQIVTVEPAAQPAVQPAAQPTESATSKAKRICRRFSAAIAGLVDVPCE